MSYRQRLVPLFIATLVGVTSGVYVFDPLLKQYAVDSRGTFDPKVAQAGAVGGIGGGVNDPYKAGAQQDRSVRNNTDRAVISGPEARERLNKVLQDGRTRQQPSTEA